MDQFWTEVRSEPLPRGGTVRARVRWPSPQKRRRTPDDRAHHPLRTQIASWRFDGHRPIAKPASRIASEVKARWRIGRRDATQLIVLLCSESGGSS